MKGFTLIETMVAITILTVAVSGTFFAANSSINASSIARDQLTASYFAQEGIELVRQARDNYYLTNGSFLLPAIGSSPYTDTYTPSGKTAFSRTVTVSGSKITSEVRWNYHGIPHTVAIIDLLTSWQ